MRALKLGIAVGAVAIATAMPAGAQAKVIVPPGNSAANQYTETAPSVGGDRLPPRGPGPSPAKALGTATADRLDELGPTGRATAALAAAGAPPRGEPSGGTHGLGGRTTPAGNGDGPSGSSGLGQVLGEATGLSSSSQSNLLLLVALLGTGIWSVAYLWRRRGRAV